MSSPTPMSSMRQAYQQARGQVDRAGLEGILLFGDDFQGFNAGFDTKTWRVVEVDPTSMQVLAVAPDFKSFIRDRIETLT